MRRARAAGGLAPAAAAGAVTLLAVVVAATATPREQDAASGGAADDAPPVAQRATDLLRAMGGTLAAARRMTFRASCTEAVVDERTGRTVHVVTQRRIALARPDRLHVTERDGLARHELWFDAGQLTVLDAAGGRFTEAETPATVDATLDHLHEAHGLAMPLADFLVSDPFAALSPAIETGVYLGEAHAGGQRCHHLAFTQPGLDWQVWIEAGGGPPVPRKLVITYTTEPGQPQFSALLSEWNLAMSLEDGSFTPAIPTDAVRVDLAELIGAPEPGGAALPSPSGSGAGGEGPQALRNHRAPPRLAMLLGAPDPKPVAQRPPPRRAGGGAAHRVRAAPRYHGTVRPRAHGSVRNYRPSGRPRGGATRRPGSRPGEVTHRSTARGTPTGGRAAASEMRRLSGHGSLRDPGDLAEWRQERRDRLSDAARRFRHADRWYFYDAGWWWIPYYDEDDVVYVTVYPAAGLALDELPEGAVEIIVGDTVYFEANGVYYVRQEDGTYVVVDGPDFGLPDPVTIVRRACGFLREQPAFTLVATDTMDHVQADGRKLQSETHRTFRLRRPDALAVAATGDDLDRSLWYDGETLTIVDRLEAAYAVTPAPGTVDATIELAVAQLGVSLPLTDLLLADPFAAIRGALRNGEHLGLVDVDGVTCHHLAFSTPDADWELWVDAGERPLPVMLAITYTSVPAHPTYIARIDAWEFAAEFAPDTFTASIPDGLDRIPFTTPLAEVQRLEVELEALRAEHQRVAQYMASQRTIALFGQIADKPDAAKRIEREQATLDAIGEVTPEEIEAYLERKQELERELKLARRAARQ